MPKFGSRNGLVGYFSSKILKISCRISNHDPQISQIGKFCEKNQSPKFRTKNPLFGVFALELKKKFYIRNQHPQVSLIEKFCEQTKMIILRNKNGFLGYF